MENLNKEDVHICTTLTLFYKNLERKTDSAKRNGSLSDLNDKILTFASSFRNYFIASHFEGAMNV